MAAAGDIKAGGAFVTLTAVDETRKGLDAAAARMKAWGASVASIGAATLAASAAAATPMLAFAQQFADEGGALQDVADRTGLAVEAVSELGYAARMSGSNLGELEAAVRTSGKLLSDAANGSQGAAEAFARLGLRVNDLLALSPDAQLERMADGVAAIDDPALRAAAAMAVFGDAGAKLVPLMAGGAKGVRELREEAGRLGLTVSGESARSAAALGDAWDRLTLSLKAATFQIGGALAPSLADLAGEATGYATSAVLWVRANQGLVLSAAKGVAVVGALGAGLVAAGVAIAGVGVALSAVSSAVGLVAAGIGALLSPVGLVTAALAGGVALWVRYTDAGRNTAAGIAEAFQGLGSSFTSSWDAIVAAVGAGDLERAFKLVGMSLEVEWNRVMVALEMAWRKVVDKVGKTIGFSTSPDQPSGLAVPGRPGESDADTLARRTREFPSFMSALPGYLSTLAGETWESMFPGRSRVMHPATRPDPRASAAAGADGGLGLLARASGISVAITAAGDRLRDAVADAMKVEPEASEGGVGLVAKSVGTLLGSSLRDLSATEKEFAESVARLNAELAKGPVGPRGEQHGPQLPADWGRRVQAVVEGVAQATAALGGSRGTFNASRAAQTLGVGDDHWKRLERRQEGTNERLDELIRVAERRRAFGP